MRRKYEEDEQIVSEDEKIRREVPPCAILLWLYTFTEHLKPVYTSLKAIFKKAYLFRKNMCLIIVYNFYIKSLFLK